MGDGQPGVEADGVSFIDQVLDLGADGSIVLQRFVVDLDHRIVQGHLGDTDQRDVEAGGWVYSVPSVSWYTSVTRLRFCAAESVVIVVSLSHQGWVSLSMAASR